MKPKEFIKELYSRIDVISYEQIKEIIETQFPELVKEEPLNNGDVVVFIACRNVGILVKIIDIDKGTCVGFKRISFGKTFRGSHNYMPKRVSQLIALGHNPSCKCCGSWEYLTFDHIIPIAKGGENRLENGQILCRRCNEVKADNILSIEELKEIINLKN